MSTRAETETVIVFNDEDEFATVDTMHARFRRACEEVIRRTGRGRERNPDHGVRDGRKVRWEFEVPKEAIAVPRVPREATEAQRAAARENMARLRGIARQPAEIGAPDAAGTAEGGRTWPVFVESPLTRPWAPGPRAILSPFQGWAQPWGLNAPAKGNGDG